VVVELEEDISWFIHRHFNPDDLPAVYEVLQASVFRTPRVTRAVLFLSNGSLSFLRHYARASLLDVRSVLIEAEYVAGVSEMPMQVHDMSLPLWHPRNRASDPLEEVAAPDRPSTLLTTAPTNRPPAASSTDRIRNDVDGASNHHSHLGGRRFQLGRVQYLIATRQANRRRVRCFRKEGTVATLVELPLAFVMEQVAERIEIVDTTF
jgi:hypothetical protein